MKKTKRRPRLPPLDLNQRYSVPEAAEYLRVSVATVNIYIAESTIETIKDGGRRFVPGAEIARKSAPPSTAKPRLAASMSSLSEREFRHNQSSRLG